MAKKEKVKKEELEFIGEDYVIPFKTVHEALGYIQVNLSCPKSQRNNFGGFSYRNCEDIFESLKPLLKVTNCHITFLNDQILSADDRIYVRTTATLHHINSNTCIEASAQAREPESKKGMDNSQVTGASSSYARKYALNGLFAIDDTKDADFYDNTKYTPVKKSTDTPVKKSTDTPGETWKPKGLPPTPLVESKIPEPNVEIMEQKPPPSFDFNKKNNGGTKKM